MTSDSAAAATRHFRVRVWNQGDGLGDGQPPPAEVVSISYTAHTEDEDKAMRQALALYERHTGYRELDAHVCFLAEWLDEENVWCVWFGLADDPDLNDPDDPTKVRSPLDDRTIHWP